MIVARAARAAGETQFLRWREDKQPQDCRYDQLEATTPFELEQVSGA